MARLHIHVVLPILTTEVTLTGLIDLSHQNVVLATPPRGLFGTVNVNFSY